MVQRTSDGTKTDAVESQLSHNSPKIYPHAAGAKGHGARIHASVDPGLSETHPETYNPCYLVLCETCRNELVVLWTYRTGNRSHFLHGSSNFHCASDRSKCSLIAQIKYSLEARLETPRDELIENSRTQTRLHTIRICLAWRWVEST